MSQESLQERWGLQENLNGHMGFAHEAIRALETKLVLPDDDRWQQGFMGLVVPRGQKSVEAVGTWGAMKTTFGDVALGTDTRIKMDPTLTAPDLFGYSHPLPNGSTPEYCEGEFSRQVDRKILGFFMNELPQMRNQHPVQPLWERGQKIYYKDGSTETTDEASIYITGNFPDGNTIHKLAQAIRSRILQQLLVGDISDEKALAVHSLERVDLSGTPLLPNVQVRQQIGDFAAEAYPDLPEENGNTVTANFTVGLVKSLNETGLVNPINISDGRISKGLLYSGRSYSFLQDVRKYAKTQTRDERTPLNYLTLAAVAALTLPTVVKLSAVAEERISEALPDGRPPSQLEKAIVARRLISEMAHNLVVERWSSEISQGNSERPADQKLLVLAPEARKDHLRQEQGLGQLVVAHTYAYTGNLAFDLDKVLRGEQSVTNQADLRRNGNGLRNRIAKRIHR